MSYIISVDELKERLHEEELAIIDVRAGEKDYQDSHIPGAVYLDVKKDLTGENSFLPPIEEFAEKLGSIGITNESTIVFYDAGNQVAASKAWFIMNYIGHEKVFILDGGFQAWTEAGGQVTYELPQREKTVYSVNEERPEMVLHIEDIKKKMKDEQSVLIDSRSYQRYIGEIEPKYKKAGHIPGAVNFASSLVLDEAGRWKESAELEKHFESLKTKDEIIVSCGAGNAACVNLVALKEAGFDNVKIYPGGFSEWIEDDENEVATGAEN